MTTGWRELVIGFMDMVQQDPRLGPSHISLYFALLHCYRQQGYTLPITVFSRDLLRQAKISARTYHACLADLIANRYIRYEPSFNPARGSLVDLLPFEKEVKPKEAVVVMNR